jgi:hypothetical protein
MALTHCGNSLNTFDKIAHIKLNRGHFEVSGEMFFLNIFMINFSTLGAGRR